MKIFLVFLIQTCLLFSVQAITDEQKNELRAIVEECKTSSGVSKEVLLKLKNGEITDEPPLRSFVSCLFRKLKFANADGTANVDRIRDRLPSGLTDDERTSIINECLALKGTDSTDTAFNIYRCYRQKTTKGHFEVLL
ncbi:PBP/GOBP family [Popillia japonica]|uniref:PBP/GOBP family n=1 Tax=Popillia japonica TaxID=7064 RepID=A0AAW1KR33_POPJA